MFIQLKDVHLYSHLELVGLKPYGRDNHNTFLIQLNLIWFITASLQNCSECTDWQMFRYNATDDINFYKYTFSVSSNISKSLWYAADPMTSDSKEEGCKESQGTDLRNPASSHQFRNNINFCFAENKSKTVKLYGPICFEVELKSCDCNQPAWKKNHSIQFHDCCGGASFIEVHCKLVSWLTESRSESVIWHQARQPVCDFYLKHYVVCHWCHISHQKCAGNSCNRRENNNRPIVK